MGGICKSLEVHAKKSLDCHEWNFKGNCGESSERKEASLRESFHEQHVIRQWRKAILVIK